MKAKFLLLILFFSATVYSQITITQSDFMNAFNPGSIYNSYMTPIPGPTISVYVGEASNTAQYWDFTGYEFIYAARSRGIEPSEAPLISEWPKANLVLFEKSFALTDDTIYTWNYKKLETTQLQLLGLSDESVVIFNYDPPAVQSAVPMMMGSTWIRERDSTYIMPDY